MKGNKTMRKLLAKLGNKINSAAVRAKTVIDNTRAEGYVDSGVKILISVVIGALLLAGLYTLFNTVIIPTATSKVSGLFAVGL